MIALAEIFRSFGDRMMGSRRYALGAIFLLCIVVYARTLTVPFFYDDFAYMVDNPLVHHPGSIFDSEAVAHAQVEADVRNNVATRPLSYVTFALNFYLHQYSLPGYHLVNIAIHLINAFLVYTLVLLTFSLSQSGDDGNGWRGSPGTTALTIAFFTAALFAVHPVMTNAVTYIVQRMASLATLFYLLAMVLYARSLLAAGGVSRGAWYILSFVSCVAAMKSKEIAFTLPLMLVLYDGVFCSGSLRQRFWRLLPYLCTMVIIPLAVSGLSSRATLQEDDLFSSSLNLVNFNHVSPLDYLLTQFRVVVTYLRMMLVPVGLSLIHPRQLLHSFEEPMVVGSLVIHLLLLATAAWLLQASRGRVGEERVVPRLCAFGIFWFYLALAVESSVIPINTLMFEYRMYLPAFGFLLALVSLLQLLRKRVPGKGGGILPIKGVLALMVVVFSLLTIARNELWRDPLRFWQDAVVLYPDKPDLHRRLGKEYLVRGDFERAVREYRQVIKLSPVKGRLHFLLGNLFFDYGHYRKAVQEYQAALEIRPDKYLVYGSLSKAYYMLGEYRLYQWAKEIAAKGNAVVPPGPETLGRAGTSPAP